MDITPGKVESTFKCNEDPLVSAKAACLTTSHSNKSGFEPFSNPAQKQSRPLLKGKTALAEASELSKQSASSNPPSAPPSPQPTPKPTLPSPGRQQPAAPVTATPAPVIAQAPPQPSRSGPVKLVVESEDLVKAGRFQAAGGKVAVQSMASIGAGWSGNAQILWTDGAQGAVLDVTVDIEEPGKFAVQLYMTRAPEYANLKLDVEGKASPVPINLFSPNVMATGPLQAGSFSLQPGPRKISFMIVGKYAQSKAYFVGLDRVVLSKIGPP